MRLVCYKFIRVGLQSIEKRRRPALMNNRTLHLHREKPPVGDLPFMLMHLVRTRRKKNRPPGVSLFKSIESGLIPAHAVRPLLAKSGRFLSD
jgi:hypothetical protein